jgi:hypothetical protein
MLRKTKIVSERRENALQDTRTDRADGSVRAPAERVSAALCAVTGADPAACDSTTQAIVAAVVAEYHAAVGSVDSLKFDPEIEEFRSASGDIRLEVDRFPVGTDRWDVVVAVVAVASLVGLVTGQAPTWVGVVALGFVTAGAAVRGAARTDVSVAEQPDD